MKEAYIRDLLPTSRNKIIEAKVCRSWIARNPPSITEKGYHAILLDKQVIFLQTKWIHKTNISYKNHYNQLFLYWQGDAIQANVEITEKKVYNLSYTWKDLPHLRVHMYSNHHWKTRHHFCLHALQNLILYLQQDFQTIISTLFLTIYYLPE